MVNSFNNLFRTKHRINIPPVTVIGLGRFGSALAQELIDNGVEVQGIDEHEKVIAEHSAVLTEAAMADTTDIEALKQLGVHDVERVVLAIGSDLEASILTASHLVEMGIPDIWAKADSTAHARILTQLGVHHVVHPERDTGRRVAHLLGGKFQDFAVFDKSYGMIKMAPPSSLCSREIDAERLWNQHHVAIVSVHTKDGGWAPFLPHHPLSTEDLIIVAGNPENLEKFSEI